MGRAPGPYARPRQRRDATGRGGVSGARGCHAVTRCMDMRASVTASVTERDAGGPWLVDNRRSTLGGGVGLLAHWPIGPFGPFGPFVISCIS